MDPLTSLLLSQSWYCSVSTSSLCIHWIFFLLGSCFLLYSSHFITSYFQHLNQNQASNCITVDTTTFANVLTNVANQSLYTLYCFCTLSVTCCYFCCWGCCCICCFHILCNCHWQMFWHIMILYLLPLIHWIIHLLLLLLLSMLPLPPIAVDDE